MLWYVEIFLTQDLTLNYNTFLNAEFYSTVDFVSSDLHLYSESKIENET